MTSVLAALAGAICVAGVVLVVLGLQRREGRPAGQARKPVGSRFHRLRRDAGSWSRWRWPLAATAAAITWLLTGWLVAGVIVAATVVGLPVLLSTSRIAAQAIDRVEALEEWSRRLADVLVVGVGLEQAIATTVRTCPDGVRDEVSALSARLSARWPTEPALRAFADDLDDASGDLIVATLILGARRRGPGLARVLAAVADSVAEEVAMRRKVEAERAKPRTTARAVTLITLGVVMIGALNGNYLAPYGTPLGQLVLAAIALGFVGSLAWMRSLTLPKRDPRILGSSDHGDTITIPARPTHVARTS